MYFIYFIIYLEFYPNKQRISTPIIALPSVKDRNYRVVMNRSDAKNSERARQDISQQVEEVSSFEESPSQIVRVVLICTGH